MVATSDTSISSAQSGTSTQENVKFNRTPYIVIAIVFLILIMGWIFLLYAMYFNNFGIFGGSTERPPPTNPDLVAVNGEIIQLTPAEQETLNLKVQQGLNNIRSG